MRSMHPAQLAYAGHVGLYRLNLGRQMQHWSATPSFELVYLISCVARSGLIEVWPR